MVKAMALGVTALAALAAGPTKATAQELAAEAPPPEAAPVLAAPVVAAPVVAAPLATAPVVDGPAIAAVGPGAGWHDAIEAHGFASLGYSANLGRPPGGESGLRVFDAADRTIGLDVVEVSVARPAAAAGEVGFRVDLVAGSSVPRVSAAAGLFRDDDGAAGNVDLQEAFVSYRVGLGAGLQIDAGKFVTPFGYEVIEGWDGYNDCYSRSIGFGHAIPFTHTGVRLVQELGAGLTARALVVNGWDNARDDNADKSVGAQLSAARGPLTAALGWMGGVEAAEGGAYRHIVDATAGVALGAVSLGLGADLGREGGAAMDGGVATWYGAALYARWEISPLVALAGRGEVFRDDGGSRTGVEQTLVEATLAPALRLGERVVVRGEVRVDRSTARVFDSEDGARRRQLTVALNALAVL
jgi:hypothetical protein